LRKNIKFLGDKGYYGIQKLYSLSRTPKKTKRDKLTRADKKSNRELAKVKLIGEHVQQKFNRKLLLFTEQEESLIKAIS
jgi:hypothetical protein